tara:strand:+ start:675 stop:1055 length:381 start_codon:yes stop_codon:yes gene_type:complete
MDNVEKVENTEQDDNTNSIQDLIKASLDKDYNNANKIFGEVMTIKMSDLLDQEKIRMADQVYNGVEEEEEDIPEDEDLADETESEDDEDDEEDSNEHTHEDGTTHSHEGGDVDHSHDDEEIEGAAV